MMRKEVLQATIAEIAKTACCAWEDYARRERGTNGASFAAADALQMWRSVELDTARAFFEGAHKVLLLLSALERKHGQAGHSRPAINAIREYALDDIREVGDPC